MPKDLHLDQLFADLERGVAVDPEQTLAALGDALGKAAREREWGTASLLALAAFRIDAGKAPDLTRISEDLSRLFAAWER